MVRDWLREAAANTVPTLLCEVGCERLCVDDIAHRLGLAKGSLYFSQRDVAEVIAATLDEWTDELERAPGLQDVSFREACRVLFQRELLGSAEHCAIPCCLAVSPCPHDWPDRWRRIGLSMGFGETDLALTLGDAIQAVASHPEIRALLQQGRIEEAVEVVTTVLGIEDEGSE